MALEKVSSILKMADEANTSAIAFNCNDYTMAYSVAAVAEELNTKLPTPNSFITFSSTKVEVRLLS